MSISSYNRLPVVYSDDGKLCDELCVQFRYTHCDTYGSLQGVSQDKNDIRSYRHKECIESEMTKLAIKL